jgi:hypothetical protein
VPGDIGTHAAHHGRCRGVRRGGRRGVRRLTGALRGDGERPTPSAVGRARGCRALIGHMRITATSGIGKARRQHPADCTVYEASPTRYGAGSVCSVCPVVAMLGDG